MILFERSRRGVRPRVPGLCGGAGCAERGGRSACAGPHTWARRRRAQPWARAGRGCSGGRPEPPPAPSSSATASAAPRRRRRRSCWTRCGRARARRDPGSGPEQRRGLRGRAWGARPQRTPRRWRARARARSRPRREGAQRPRGAAPPLPPPPRRSPASRAGGAAPAPPAAPPALPCAAAAGRASSGALGAAGAATEFIRGLRSVSPAGDFYRWPEPRVREPHVRNNG